MLNLFPWLSPDPQPQPPAKRWRRKYTKSQKLYAIRGATAQARRRLELEAEREKLINDNQILKRRVQGLGAALDHIFASFAANMSFIKEVQWRNGWDSPVTGVKP
jgi:hypothetical protein